MIICTVADVAGLAWDPYLGDVESSEKDEDPPLYVPPPPIPLEGVCPQVKLFPQCLHNIMC